MLKSSVSITKVPSPECWEGSVDIVYADDEGSFSTVLEKGSIDDEGTFCLECW